MNYPERHPETVDYQDCPPVLNFTPATIDHFMQQEKWEQLFSLYVFYCRKSLYQQTSQVWATTKYTAKKMGWSVGKVQRVKKCLLELNYLQEVQARTGDRGRFGKHYIRVRYRPVHRFSGDRKTRGAVKPSTNMLKEKTIGICSKRVFSKEKTAGYNPALLGGTSSSKNGNGKLTTFALRWGVKIQHKLKIQGSYTTKDHQVHHSPVKSTTWAKEIQYILHSMHIDRDTFKSIMSWYLKEGYKLPPPQAPRLFRVKDLVDKWPALAHAYERSRAAADTGMRYRQGADGEYGYYDDSLDA